MLRRFWLPGVMLGLFAGLLLAKPGVVRTRDGSTFQGDVTEDDKNVYIAIHGVQTTIDKRNVAKVDYPQSLDEQYAQQHSKLAADDVKGRIALANWASQNQRQDLAIAALEEARKIDPTNRQAALLLDTAQRQQDLDQRQGTGVAAPANPAPTTVATSQPAPATAPVATGSTATTDNTPLEHRLLNADEINVIRQDEMLPNEKLQVRFDNNVVRKYLATGEHDAAAFRRMTPIQQAQDILANGDPKMAKDVRIVTDPQPLVEFRQKINPLVASSCGSTACHGGTHAGNLGFYSGDSAAAIYTNFYIMQTYKKTIDAVEYRMLDRTYPQRSLFLEYGLAPDQADTVHPKAANFRPRFRTRTDPAYRVVTDWLTNSVKQIQPVYGIKVAPNIPTSQPTK